MACSLSFLTSHPDCEYACESDLHLHKSSLQELLKYFENELAGKETDTTLPKTQEQLLQYRYILKLETKIELLKMLISGKSI